MVPLFYNKKLCPLLLGVYPLYTVVTVSKYSKIENYTVCSYFFSHTHTTYTVTNYYKTGRVRGGKTHIYRHTARWGKCRFGGALPSGGLSNRLSRLKPTGPAFDRPIEKDFLITFTFTKSSNEMRPYEIQQIELLLLFFVHENWLF